MGDNQPADQELINIEAIKGKQNRLVNNDGLKWLIQTEEGQNVSVLLLKVVPEREEGAQQLELCSLGPERRHQSVNVDPIRHH